MMPVHLCEEWLCPNCTYCRICYNCKCIVKPAIELTKRERIERLIRFAQFLGMPGRRFHRIIKDLRQNLKE